MSDVVEPQNIYSTKKLTFVIIMHLYFQEHTSEYAAFIEEYNCFLKHYAQSQLLVKKTTASICDNTEIFFEYTQAVEAHLDATKAYIRLIAMYEQLLLKYLHNVHM